MGAVDEGLEVDEFCIGSRMECGLKEVSVFW